MFRLNLASQEVGLLPPCNTQPMATTSIVSHSLLLCLCSQVSDPTGVSSVKRLSRNAALWSPTRGRSTGFISSTPTASDAPRSLCVRTAASPPTGPTSTLSTCGSATRAARLCGATTGGRPTRTPTLAWPSVNSTPIWSTQTLATLSERRTMGKLPYVWLEAVTVW